MVRKTLLSRPATSLADWLDRTGTNQAALARVLKAKGIPMTRQQLSDILRRAKPCRLRTACVLSDITGVPVQKLVAWGKSKRHRIPTTAPKRSSAQIETSGGDAGDGV
jgi:uncharacterized protein YgbK (DUF1537 family)